MRDTYESCVASHGPRHCVIRMRYFTFLDVTAVICQRAACVAAAGVKLCTSEQCTVPHAEGYAF